MTYFISQRLNELLRFWKISQDHTKCPRRALNVEVFEIWEQTEERNATSESSLGINTNQSCNKNIHDASPFGSIPSIRVNFLTKFNKDLTVLSILKALATAILFLQNSTKKTPYHQTTEPRHSVWERNFTTFIFCSCFHHCMLFPRSFWWILKEQRLP